MNILDSYVKTEPRPQNALDIFAQEWSSAMPAESGLVAHPGTAGLFADPRIDWADARLGFAGRTILELGPLEAGHSFMMQQRGAASVTAIESNTRAYLKCLIVKEVFQLDRVRFLLGDFNAYLADHPPRTDICVASGVLYHCIDPLKTLVALTRIADRLFLWTHYWDKDVILANSGLVNFFDEPQWVTVDGKKFPSAIKRYKQALEWTGFCGGTSDYARWLSRDAILHSIATAGFSQIDIAFDDPLHPNGPAFAVCAIR